MELTSAIHTHTHTYAHTHTRTHRHAPTDRRHMHTHQGAEAATTMTQRNENHEWHHEQTRYPIGASARADQCRLHMTNARDRGGGEGHRSINVNNTDNFLQRSVTFIPI